MRRKKAQLWLPVHDSCHDSCREEEIQRGRQFGRLLSSYRFVVSPWCAPGAPSVAMRGIHGLGRSRML